MTGLFSIQHAGTSRIGKAFGPVMLVWFTFLGVTGVLHIFENPVVLAAFNPMRAVRILFSPANKRGFIHRSVASGTELTRFEEFILTAKYRIREMIGSQAHWYGLDTSSLIVESVPLSAPRRAGRTQKPVLVK